MSFNVVSTFCGPGGSTYGYKQAGLNVVTSLDYAPSGFSNKIIETYRSNHDSDLIVQDAREIDPERLEKNSNPEIDILDGSPPCSPFSTSNTKVNWGDHKSGTLFDTYTYWLRELQPKVFVAENVPGLAEGKNKGYFNLLLQNMREAGYKVNCQKIKPRFLGAGHRRERLIFIGVRKDLELNPPKVKPSSKPRTVSESLQNIQNTEKQLNQAKDTLEKQKTSKTMKKMGQGETLSDYIDNYGYTFHRLHEDKPAPTMTASSIIIHPTENRCITIPELKAIIGIPQSYNLTGSYHQKWECGIRCLPPELIQNVGKAVKTQILEKT